MEGKEKLERYIKYREGKLEELCQAIVSAGAPQTREDLY